MYIDTCKLQDTIFKNTGVEFEDYEESLRYFGSSDPEVAKAIQNLTVMLESALQDWTFCTLDFLLIKIIDTPVRGFGVLAYQ